MPNWAVKVHILLKCAKKKVVFVQERLKKDYFMFLGGIYDAVLAQKKHFSVPFELFCRRYLFGRSPAGRALQGFAIASVQAPALQAALTIPNALRPAKGLSHYSEQ